MHHTVHDTHSLFTIHLMYHIVNWCTSACTIESMHHPVNAPHSTWTHVCITHACNTVRTTHDIYITHPMVHTQSMNRQICTPPVVYHQHIHYSKQIRKLEMFGAIFHCVLKIAWYLIYHTYYLSFVNINVKCEVNWSKSDKYTVLWRWVGSCTENCKFANTQYFVVYATPCVCVRFVHHSVVWLSVSSMICISGFSINVTMVIMPYVAVPNLQQMGPNATLQQNNTRPHKPRAVITFLQQSNVDVFAG